MPPHFLDFYDRYDSYPLSSSLDESQGASPRPSLHLRPSTAQVFKLSRHAHRRHIWNLAASPVSDMQPLSLQSPPSAHPNLRLENAVSPLFLYPQHNTDKPAVPGYKLPFTILAGVVGFIILIAAAISFRIYRKNKKSKLRAFRLDSKKGLKEQKLGWKKMRPGASRAGSAVQEKMEAETILKRVTVVLDRMRTLRPKHPFCSEEHAVHQPRLPPLALAHYEISGVRQHRHSFPKLDARPRSSKTASFPRLPSLAPSAALYTISEDEEQHVDRGYVSPAVVPSEPASASLVQEAQSPMSRLSTPTSLARASGVASSFEEASSASLTSLESVDLADQLYSRTAPSAMQSSTNTASMPDSMASTPTPSTSGSRYDESDDSTISAESDLTEYQLQLVDRHSSASFKRASILSFPLVALEGSKMFPSVVVTTSPSIAETDVRRTSLALEIAAATSMSSTGTASTYACLNSFPKPPEGPQSLLEEIESSLLWRQAAASDSELELVNAAVKGDGRDRDGFAKLVRDGGSPRLSGLGLGLSFPT